MRNLAWKALLVVGLVTGAFAIPGLLSAQERVVVLKCDKPVMTAVEGYPEEQTKGDVSIKCVLVPFVEKVVYHKTLKEKPKGLLSVTTGNAKKYLVTEEPKAYSFDPERLTFKLRFANNTGHVLRFTDCLLSLTIDNQQAEIDKAAEDQLRKSVILPHGTAELSILGPKAQGDRVLDTTKTIFDTAKVVMLSIFDVTTQVDEANNPTTKATFEWIYENKPSVTSTMLKAVTTEEKLLPEDAQKMRDQWYFK